MAKVLILCPTFDHVDTLYASIASARVQSFTEWEMAVIGDGAPDRTFAILDAIAAEEPRVSAYRHPKSERYGEPYRDPVIRASDAEFICQLSDDDLWAPNHLAEMVAMLERAEWVNQAPLRVLPSGETEWYVVNLGTPEMRETAARAAGISVGPNYVGYRREAYMRLPEGWTCAPREAGPSDRFMWSKFFRDAALTVASSAESTAIKLPSQAGVRARRTPEQRMAELGPWLARCAEPGLTDRLRHGSFVGPRLLRLFAVHGGAHCETLELGFDRSGLAPVDADVRPQPAVGGAPMILPLTPRQRRDAWRAWTMLRAYAGAPEDAEPARRELRADLGDSPKPWRRLIRALATGLDAETGLRAARDFRVDCPRVPASHALAAELMLRAGRVEEAKASIAVLERSWPGLPALARLRQQQAGETPTVGPETVSPSA